MVLGEVPPGQPGGFRKAVLNHGFNRKKGGEETVVKHNWGLARKGLVL